MTKSTITDERITSVIERLEHFASNLKWTDVRGAQDLLTAADGLRELQERRKAAMDSEPVTQDEREAFEAFMAKRFGDLVDQRRAKNGDYGYIAWDMVVAWIVWQARAMLQAEPVTTANKLGNSPVIPDGYVMVPKEPTESMINAWLSEVANWRGHVAGYKAMLAAAHTSIPMNSTTWIPVSERKPEESGRYWCYVEEQNSLGKSHYQWNCTWNGEIWGGAMMYGRVTHWMPLPAAPQEVR